MDYLGSFVASLVELKSLLMSIFVAFLCGVTIALTYAHRSRYTQSLVITLAMLPCIVAVVIAFVNGNVGAGVAVAGAFSLVRFRSVPGSGRDILFVFMAMAIGLVCGMGEWLYSLLICAVMCVLALLLHLIWYEDLSRELRITVPESLEFDGAFDDVLKRHTSALDLVGVKTAGMGSLYKLTYRVRLRDLACSKALLDDIRTLNGNLEVSLGRTEENYAL